MQKGPLQGMRIIDLSILQAGPYGSLILGDLGAEVIKIEPPAGDFSRFFPFFGHKGESYYYLAFNRSKKSLALDLRKELCKEAFYDLVKVSDVVYDNFSPGTLEKLGADFETLKKVNPKIISCSITGYGSSGPYRDRRSFDLIAQAMSGGMSITGEPGRPPCRAGVSIADMAGGMYAAHGVMAAYIAREKTGRPQRIEVSLLDGQIALLSYVIAFHIYSGIVPGPQGSGHLAAIPYRAYKTKDDWIVICEGWPRIARVLDIEQYIDDPRFNTREARLKHRAEFDQILEEAFLKQSADVWLELLNVEDIPCGRVNTIDRAVTDPQVLHNNMILQMEHPLGGKIRLAGNPIKSSENPDEEYIPPPTQGQDTEHILRDILRYPQDKIDKIKNDVEEGAKEILKKYEDISDLIKEGKQQK